MPQKRWNPCAHPSINPCEHPSLKRPLCTSDLEISVQVDINQPETVSDLEPFLPKPSTLTVSAVRALSPPPPPLTSAAVAIIASVEATAVSPSAPLHLWQPRVGPSTLCLPPLQRQQKQQPSLPHIRGGTQLSVQQLETHDAPSCVTTTLCHKYDMSWCKYHAPACPRNLLPYYTYIYERVPNAITTLFLQWIIKAIIIIDMYTNINNRSRCTLGYKPCEHRKIESSLILSCGVHRAYSQMDIGYDYHNKGSGFVSLLYVKHPFGGVRIWVGVQK